MATVAFDIPDDAIPSRFRDAGDFAAAIRLAAAMLWYSRGEVSHGNAARIAGISRVEFIDALAKHELPAFVVDMDDLRRELRRDDDARGQTPHPWYSWREFSCWRSCANRLKGSLSLTLCPTRS